MFRKIFSRLFNKNVEYDQFPINLLESKGSIKRTPFDFKSSKIILYGPNGLKKEISVKNSIHAKVSENGSLNVSFSFSVIMLSVQTVKIVESLSNMKIYNLRQRRSPNTGFLRCLGIYNM